MKKGILVLLLVSVTMSFFGQALFFDNLTNSTWKSESGYNDSTIRVSTVIGLKKVNNSTDSLKVHVTLWTFKDSALTINYYDCHLKKDSLITSYRYHVDADKGILKIILHDDMPLEYEVGITSTGKYVYLTRTKIKDESYKIHREEHH